MIKITIEIDEKTKEVVVTKAPKQQEEIRISPMQKMKLNKSGKKTGVIAEKTCLRCGKKYQPTSNVQRYCSKYCGIQAPVKEYPTSEEIERSQSKPYSELR